MTRDEILSMEPGLELDVLVAEKVMGFRFVVDKAKGISSWIGYGAYGEAHTPPMAWRRWNYKVPPYSTSISAAWEVVEYMRTRNDNGAFIDIYPGADEFYVTARGKHDYHVTAQNAPETICKAALLAVMDG